MSYRIVVVDDEEIMRDGLVNLVDWSTMRFEVAARFEDGKDAIGYLDNNPVDVVLTDVKMTFVSGIDLAMHVNERGLPAKVVLISGYKDFEYARQALNYNVFHYLLKPFSFKDIKQVFSAIKNELDKDREYKQKEEEKRQHYAGMIELLHKQFFTDLAQGLTPLKK